MLVRKMKQKIKSMENIHLKNHIDDIQRIVSVIFKDHL